MKEINNNKNELSKKSQLIIDDLKRFNDWLIIYYLTF